MSDNLLSKLIGNAFDFLEKGIGQFKDDPKYSVINFCAAVELLLKARLMHEHWSLIVDTPKHPNLNSFNSGNFKSINFKDIIPRIEDVTGEKIPQDATEAFNRLANHRNKMIHFFHEAHSGIATEKLLEEIAIEQCNCWFYLRRLLEKWDNIFSDNIEKISNINRRMKLHDIYLNTVYLRIIPELNIDRKKGIIFRSCNRCGKVAAEETKNTDYLYQYKCRVCLFEYNLLRIPCPTEECENILIIAEFHDDDEISCESGHCLTRDDLLDILNTNPVTIDNYFEDVAKNCATCQGQDSVIEHEAYYICVECLYVSDEIAYCGWCGEGQIGGGDLEMSNYSGCEFCDGQADRDS